MSDRYIVVKSPKECPYRKLFDIHEKSKDIGVRIYLCTKNHDVYNILNCNDSDIFDEVNCPLKSCRP